MRRIVIFVVSLIVGVGASSGQEVNPAPDSAAVVTSSFWDNWFVQMGVDMSLQNPYGCDFTHTFPKGKSYGVDAALGKWFTHQVGFRGKMNVEHAFLQSDHAVWLKSYRNGYLTLQGDVLVDVQNLFGEYQPDKKWSLLVYPRIGAFINLTGDKGSPLLGLGISSTYRLNNRWSLYADAAYQVMTSVNGIATDTGSGSNGYLDIGVGVQLNLGKQGFHRLSDNVEHDDHSVVVNSFWSNWFVQTGLGMSLLNPHGSNFSKVFPNGKTLGINLAIGKWISPEFGVRGGLNWQNGIVGNHHLGWLDASGAGSNHEAGGYVAAYMDVMLDLHNAFCDYDPNRFWNAIVYPRAGLDSNREGKTGSPLAGLGTLHTFKVSDRMKLFIDAAYQVTSSEFMNGKSTNPGTGSGSNGWFDLNLGIQFDLGKNFWENAK